MTLLFFGYTHCPDMRPVQMYMVANALRKLPPATAGQFKVVFVTTDPARDTPQVLRRYFDRFNKSSIGLTGSEEAVEATQVAANLPPRKGPCDQMATMKWATRHLSSPTPKTNLAHVIYPVGLRSEDGMHDLPLLVSETWTKP